MANPNQKPKWYLIGRVFKNLSITKKLAMIILMFALFLVLLAVTSITATQLLSGFKAYVGGEGLYSKAQKDAVYYLLSYAASHNEDEYERFLKFIKVPLADRNARLELEKPNPDLEIASMAFMEARNHPKEVKSMIQIFTLLRNNRLVDKAISIWADADNHTVKLKRLGEELHKTISKDQVNGEKVQSIVNEINIVNKSAMSILDEFSATCGEATRMAKSFLVRFMVIITLLSIAAGVLISLSISNDIRKKVFLLKDGADRIAGGNLETKIDLESKDELGGLAVAFNDMSDRLFKTKEELETACEEALGASRLKSAFLANMSHEIRTPMNAVIGFASMLFDTDLNEDQLEYARAINTSGEALLSLIDDILDFSKIEAGELDFVQVDFDPGLLAYDVCAMVRHRIGSKPIEILCRTGDNLPSLVRGDPGRFRQVLTNLMGNASKFTESGEIELTLNIEEETDDEVKLYASVRDTGIGIPKDKLDVIFTPFQQLDSSTTRKYGGTGLGLSICRQIANIAHGDIWAESELGKGSILHSTAWFGKSEEKELKKVTFTSVSLSNKKVLIVDDNRTNLDILTHVLELAGMRVAALASGEEVVPTLQKALKGEDPFDLCILDIQMPGMSGYEVAKEIRDPKYKFSYLPLLALSSSMERDARKCEEAGFDGFLNKPAPREKLYQMLERIIGERKKIEEFRPSIITRHLVSEEMKRSVRILLAEDNPVNQKLAEMMLTKAGYQVEVANNGREAVEKYTSSPEDFDLILMDVQMPEMDGMEATETIRRSEEQLRAGDELAGKTKPGGRHIPIIAMTAHAMKGDREKSLEAGMDDYIAKPIKRKIVFDVLEKWIFDKEAL